MKTLLSRLILTAFLTALSMGCNGLNGDGNENYAIRICGTFKQKDPGYSVYMGARCEESGQVKDYSYAGSYMELLYTVSPSDLAEDGSYCRDITYGNIESARRYCTVAGDTAQPMIIVMATGDSKNVFCPSTTWSPDQYRIDFTSDTSNDPMFPSAPQSEKDFGKTCPGWTVEGS